MRKFLIIGSAAIALTMTSACTRKMAPEYIPPAAQGPATDPNVDPRDVDLTELPAMQADLVAKAGSDTVYFGTDKYELDGSSRATLAAQAKWMLANPRVRASIEGHADERGTREYNMALGERRANATRDFLASQG
ncbi:MAG: OmpA family protein, partial [Sphingomicrobium sp.]